MPALSYDVCESPICAVSALSNWLGELLSVHGNLL
jgi:hypothetical protein